MSETEADIIVYERGDTSRCMNCHKPITYESFVGMGFWEPDVDEASYRAGWRHTATGYGGCDFGGRRFAEPGWPETVVLCGSTKFKDVFIEAMKTQTLEGRIVLTVGMFGHVEGLGMDGSVKVQLDELHKRKIDLADRVLVLNVDGYIGDSTASEIAYAMSSGKVITYLNGPSITVGALATVLRFSSGKLRVRHEDGSYTWKKTP